MSAKKHGTSATPVQANLRYNCDHDVADRICNFNRHYAEHAGYFTKRLEKPTDEELPITFYDSNSGLALFRAPVNRTWQEFVNESKRHGWPSFRDDEVVWENVRCLKGGEAVSLAGARARVAAIEHHSNVRIILGYFR